MARKSRAPGFEVPQAEPDPVVAPAAPADGAEAPAAAAPAPPELPPQRKRFARSLLVKVPDSRVLVLSRELAQCLTRLDELEAEMGTAVSGFKDAMKEQKERVAAIREQVRTGEVEEPVECEEVKDYDARAAYVVRLDTGERIETRALSEGELQIGLSFPQEAAASTLKHIGQVAEAQAAHQAAHPRHDLPAEPAELPGDEPEDEDAATQQPEESSIFP